MSYLLKCRNFMRLTDVSNINLMFDNSDNNLIIDNN